MYGLIALGLAATAAALPTTSPKAKGLATRDGAFSDSYTMHWGDGSAGQGWTPIENWASWEQLWNYNSDKMRQTCGWNGYAPENTGDEINGIKKAIERYANEAQMDKRFILAVVMQESKGCVRVKTTTSPDGRVTNPGLMQTHNGSGSCFQRFPCPDDAIDQMIRDGVMGTSSGDGLRQTLDKAVQRVGQKNGQAYYRAAREYNSVSASSY